MKFLLFTSSTCKACPAMKRNLATAGIHYDELNVDNSDNVEIAGTYRVRSLPTLVIIKNGVPVETILGSPPLGTLREIKGRYCP